MPGDSNAAIDAVFVIVVVIAFAIAAVAIGVAVVRGRRIMRGGSSEFALAAELEKARLELARQNSDDAQPDAPLGDDGPDPLLSLFPAPMVAAEGSEHPDSLESRLVGLTDLHERGLITDTELAEARMRLLTGA